MQTVAETGNDFLRFDRNDRSRRKRRRNRATINLANKPQNFIQTFRRASLAKSMVHFQECIRGADISVVRRELCLVQKLFAIQSESFSMVNGELIICEFQAKRFEFRNTLCFFGDFNFWFASIFLSFFFFFSFFSFNIPYEFQGICNGHENVPFTSLRESIIDSRMACYVWVLILFTVLGLWRINQILWRIRVISRTW